MRQKLIVSLTLTAIILGSCINEEKGAPGPETGEESVVTLLIYDGTKGTRAAGGQTETPTTGESTIRLADGIKLVVFNESGQMVYPTGSAPLTLTVTETPAGSGIYETQEFKLTTGNKYFYIFANDATGIINIPVTPPSRTQFIAQTAVATLSGTDDFTNLTTPNFLMGTLWSEKTVAPGGGTPGDPQRVQLTIGRLVSKVTLNGVSKGTSSVQGTFGPASYRLGTIPKKIFTVGNNDENLVTPPKAGHGVVKSAVHNAPIYTAGVSDANFYEFTSTWKNVSNTTPESFYTVENTTEPDGFGIQYYGNTSFIQIRTTYTPHVSEVYNVDDLSARGSFTGPTFYTANLLSTGARLIFEQDPRTAAGLNPHSDIDQNSILVYNNGINYHKFPIHDPESGLPDVQRNAVLRNHSYHYTVTSIADIGTPGESVDPVEPIETETTLIIQATIAPWSKIENINVPI